MIRILFVDDEVGLLDIGKCFLETNSGFVVDTTQSVHQALSLLKKYDYDVIISDYMMPQMDGLVFLSRVRSINPRIPFIFFTGHGDEQTVIQALNGGADYYLKKNCEAGSQFLELSQLIKMSVARVRSDTEREKSEEKFRTIADFTYDWMYWLDPEGSLIYISPSCERMTGYTQEEFYSDPDLIARVVHPDDHSTWNSHCNQDNSPEGSFTLDFRIIHKTGDIRWVNHVCQPVCDQSGKSRGRRVNNRDITKRKVSETLLQKERDNFLKIFKASPVGLLLLDEHTIITRANEAIGSMVLRDPAEIIRERAGGGLGCIHSLEQPRGCGYSLSCPECPLRRGIESVIVEGSRIHGAVIPLTLHMGGREQQRWLSINAEPVDIEGSRHVIVAVDDITEQREVMEKLQESEEKFRILSENTIVAIMIYQDDHWIYANPAAEKITGYTQEELISLRFWEIVHPDNQEKLRLNGLARLQGQVVDPQYYTVTIVRSDGILRQAELVGSSVLLGGKCAGLITAIDITDRKEAENRLISSEAKFRSIFENQIDLYYQSDIDGIILMLSPSCEKLTGFVPADLIGHSVTELYSYPEQRAGLLHLLFKDGAVYDYEVLLRNKAGIDVPVSINCHIIYDIQGNPERIEGTIRDITERKQIENALRRSEEHYRSLFAHMLEGFAYCRMIYDEQGDPDDWIYLSVNEAFGRLTGLGDVEGKHVTEVLPSIKELSPELFRIYGRVVSTGVPETFEIDFRPLNAWLHVSVYRIERDHFVAVFEDISQRKRDELVLRDLNRDLRLILDNVPAMIWYKDTKNTLLQVNKAACQILGNRVEEVTGKNFSYLSPEKGDDYYQDDLMIIQTGQPRLGIVEQFTTTQGEKIWVQTDKVPIKDEKNTVTGILVLGIDITERIMAKNAIALANKKLNLLSSITRHDILNQVQGLFFALELAGSGSVNPDLKILLDKAMGFSQNIRRQIGFTRDYQNIGVNSPEWQDVHDVIIRVAPGLALDTISLLVEIEGLFVYADPLLEKVFYNLMDNAKRYGDTITWIRFYGNGTPEGYSLICEDNGVGIPDKYKEGIFIREYYKHTGFGLNLSREILDITGITIRETGEAGKGARFEISIPKGVYRLVTPG